MFDDVSDYELQKDGRPPSLEARSPLPWILASVLIAVAAGTTWFYFFSGRGSQQQSSATQAETAAAPATRPLGGPADAIPLPPLDETDALVRQLVSALSSHPAVAAWLATDDLLRGFTVAVDNIADGVTPARRLGALRPAGGFRVIDTDDDVSIDPRSYQRYAPLAGAIDSLDTEGTARLYSTLKPRIEDAYAELGRDRSFDVALERAFVAMLQTPALDGEVRVVPRGAVLYAFENSRIEQLTAAQKQLARMGPGNVRAIQGKLRQLALALGIPSERLPQ
jgi:Protein of unknown function (DUF3014)